MKRFGLIRAEAVVPEVTIADPMANAQKISDMIRASRSDVLVFPELSVTGYTCADLFGQEILQKRVLQALKKIAQSTGENKGLLVFVGAPLRYRGKLYDCAVAAANGKLLGAVPKNRIRSFGGSYETRWFESGAGIREAQIRIEDETVPFGTDLLFCDEGSDLIAGVQIGADLTAPAASAEVLAQCGANVIVHLGAEPEVLTGEDKRRQQAAAASARLLCGYVFSSAGMDESTSDSVFSGHSMIAEKGKLKAEQAFAFGSVRELIDLEHIAYDRQHTHFAKDMPEEKVRFVGYTGNDEERLPEHVERFPFIPEEDREREARCRQIIRLQATGLAVRMKKTGIRKAVLGISGGLDSTLALIVTAEAFRMAGLPAENIITVTMPGFGTSQQTFKSAQALMDLFGAQMRVIPITDACLQHFKDIGHDPKDHDVTYENAQARERTQILMDIANKEGGLVVGTGDLSELALGWCTYNGDHMSMYGVNGGVPKTLVKYVIASFARENPEFAKPLQDVLDTPISPELLPPDAQGNIAQKTEERIGKYDLHDFILYHTVRYGSEPDKVFALLKIAFDDVPRDQMIGTMKTFYSRFFSQQFKRNCMPDGVGIGTVGLSPRADWRMPSEASAKAWLDMCETL